MSLGINACVYNLAFGSREVEVRWASCGIYNAKVPHIPSGTSGVMKHSVPYFGGMLRDSSGEISKWAHA